MRRSQIQRTSPQDFTIGERVQMPYVIRGERERRVGEVLRINRKSVVVLWDSHGWQRIACVGLLEPVPKVRAVMSIDSIKVQVSDE